LEDKAEIEVLESSEQQWILVLRCCV